MRTGLQNQLGMLIRDAEKTLEGYQDKIELCKATLRRPTASVEIKRIAWIEIGLYTRKIAAVKAQLKYHITKTLNAKGEAI